MDFILLLRGINVGGNHSVKMAELKENLTNLELDNVTSYINSGNLFFSSLESQDALQVMLESYFKNNYSFDIPFLLINQTDYQKEFEALPECWQEDYFRKNALFFLPNTKNEDIDNFLEIANFSQDELIHIGEFAIYWIIKKEGAYPQSFYHTKFIKTKLYKLVSIRNFKTAYYLAFKQKHK
ncbi:hypothetical protein BI362_07455 [Streptococcus parauberis]|nr:hypothetical protein BI362_07455 [Streptococcus parauberis]